MGLLNKIVSLVCWCLVCHFSFSQRYTVSPTVPDFTDLTASCVVATYGPRDNPFESFGIAEGHHTVVTQQGTDPNCKGKVALLPTGESRVVRLGNFKGKEAESLTYHFIVDPENSLFVVQQAVVLYDGEILKKKIKPHFVVRILDASGNFVNSCCQSDFSLLSCITGDSENSFYTPPCWRNWVTDIFDLSSCSGREVQVQFITYDGDLDTDFGYAYFTAHCVPNKLKLENCNGKAFTLTAPDGFVRYEWFNGMRSRSIELEMGDSDMELSCGAVAGCRSVYRAYVSDKGTLPAKSHTYFDTVFQGESYAKHTFDLGKQKQYGTFAYNKTFCDLVTCNSEISYFLILTVKQCYYPIEVQICRGEDYLENGFVFQQPQSGVHYDTIRYISSVGSDSIVTLKLSVFTAFSLADLPEGNTSPCTGMSEVYVAPHTENIGTYRWDVPEGFMIIEGQATPRITVMLTDSAAKGMIVFHGANGCGEGRGSLNVSPHSSYWAHVTDSVCLGGEYHNYGFHLPVQETLGSRIYYQFDKTRQGCDSTISLVLNVLSTPEIKVIFSDSVVCQGTEVKLQVVPITYRPDSKMVMIGDILCTDGTTIKSEKYSISGKMALGVVFWVDDCGQHGWAVHLYDQGEECAWTRDEAILIPYVAQYQTLDLAMMDTNGYMNTKMVWDYGNRGDYPVLRDVKFDEGWYIPALGQLSRLYGSIELYVNPSLSKVGGDLLVNIIGYWSSTQINDLLLGGLLFNIEEFDFRSVPKYFDLNFNVRAVRNF